MQNGKFYKRLLVGGVILCIIHFVTLGMVWANPSGFLIQNSQGHGKEFWLGNAPSIQTIAVSQEGDVFAGSFGMGVFRSNNHGETWTAVNTGLTDTFILSLVIDRQHTMYVGTVRGGIFRSSDNGNHWVSMNAGLKQVEIKSLLAHETGIYAGTGKGVYIWNSIQEKWLVVAKGLDQVLVSSLVFLKDHTLLAGTAGKGLFRLNMKDTDEPAWEPIDGKMVDAKERLVHRFIRKVAIGPDHQIFVGTQDGGIFQSVDSGKSWKPFGRHLPNDSIRSILPISGTLMVGTGRGIYRTSGAKRWKASNEGLTELSIQVLINSGHGQMYVGTSSGAFRSDDDGKHWINVSEGFGSQPKGLRPYF
jgi:ligand-binding sensor domain-containing protein